MKKAFLSAIGLMSLVALTAEQVVVHSEFEQDQLTLSNAIRGSVSDADMKETSPVFVKKTKTTTLKLDGQEVSFPATGLFSNSSGSVSFRFKPLNWPRETVKFLPVFAIDTGRGHGWKMLLFYERGPKSPWGFFSLHLHTTVSKDLCLLQLPVYRNLHFDGWNQLVVGWNAQGVSLTFNGKQYLHKPFPPEMGELPAAHPNDKAVFMPAIFWGVRSTVQTEIAKIVFYSTALTEAEAKADFTALPVL